MEPLKRFRSLEYSSNQVNRKTINIESLMVEGVRGQCAGSDDDDEPRRLRDGARARVLIAPP